MHFSVDGFIADAGLDTGIAKEALFYMDDLHDVFTSRSPGFPYGEDARFGLSERVLVRKSILDIICDYYRWHYINPRQRLESVSPTDWFARHQEDASVFFDEVDFHGLPKWFAELPEADRVLIMEIDAALKGGLTALPIMGLRALLDSAVRVRVGDRGGFAKNLGAFYEAGQITQSHRDLLLAAFDAGSATIHRSYVPGKNDVQACLEMVKHLLHGLHVVEPRVREMQGRVPRREKQGK